MRVVTCLIKTVACDVPQMREKFVLTLIIVIILCGLNQQDSIKLQVYTGIVKMYYSKV